MLFSQKHKRKSKINSRSIKFCVCGRGKSDTLLLDFEIPCIGLILWHGLLSNYSSCISEVLKANIPKIVAMIRKKCQKIGNLKFRKRWFNCFWVRLMCFCQVSVHSFLKIWAFSKLNMLFWVSLLIWARNVGFKNKNQYLFMTARFFRVWTL